MSLAEYAALAQAVAAALTFAVTAWYAILTRGILKRTSEMAEADRVPLVSVNLVPVRGTPVAKSFYVQLDNQTRAYVKVILRFQAMVCNEPVEMDGVYAGKPWLLHPVGTQHGTWELPGKILNRSRLAGTHFERTAQDWEAEHEGKHAISIEISGTATTLCAQHLKTEIPPTRWYYSFAENVIVLDV